jgi:hypothetical protein
MKLAEEKREVSSVQSASQTGGEKSKLDKTILRLDTAIERLRDKRFLLMLEKIGYS